MCLRVPFLPQPSCAMCPGISPLCRSHHVRCDLVFYVSARRGHQFYSLCHSHQIIWVCLLTYGGHQLNALHHSHQISFVFLILPQPSWEMVSPQAKAGFSACRGHQLRCAMPQRINELCVSFLPQISNRVTLPLLSNEMCVFLSCRRHQTGSLCRRYPMRCAWPQPLHDPTIICLFSFLPQLSDGMCFASAIK